VWYNDGNSTQWVVANNTQIQVGVSSFNARQGAVTLTPNDVRAASTGVTDGSNAAAGQIGELLSITSGATLGLSSGVPANYMTLGLTAGDWDVWGSAYLSASVGAALTTAALSTVSGALGSAYNVGGIVMVNYYIASNYTIAPTQRISVSTPTTIYLVVQANFSSGTGSCTAGAIFARRVR
jgi:hypothetical protein